MPFPIRCVNPACAKVLKVPNHIAGQIGQCPLCKKKLRVPVPEVFRCEIEEQQIKQLDISVAGKAFDFIIDFMKDKQVLMSIVQIDLLWDPGVAPIWQSDEMRAWFEALRKSRPTSLYWLTEDSAILYLHMVTQPSPNDPEKLDPMHTVQFVSDATPILRGAIASIFGDDEIAAVRTAERLRGRVQRILQRHGIDNIFI